jgi:transposase
MEAITIGLDIAKSVFQVHGVDAEGEVVVRRQLRRSQVIPFFEKLSACLIGIEACPTSHHWSRALQALGHEVRLMPPSYVKPYVKRSKNDAGDAAAICEAVRRPTMRFVATKSIEQQSVLMLHRSRELLVRQRTMLVNAIRGHMAESGIVAPVGLPRVKELLAVIADREDERIPPLARTCLESLAVQLMSLEREIRAAEQRIHAWHRSNQVSQRLASIPGIGPITASALAASVPDPTIFKSGRALAAWIGLLPRQNSTGGKPRLGRISKQGDQYLRWLLVAGAMTMIRHAKRRGTTNLPWLADIIARKPAKVAAVALANKTARIAWVLLARHESYQAAKLRAPA